MSTRARDVLAHIRAVQRSLEKLREPIEVAPFLAWCAQREARIRAEIDNYPAISGKREGGVTPRLPTGEDAHGRLVMELGWNPDTGARRLHRWTHEIAGAVERATIEEALFTAGVDFHDIYPDEPAPRPVSCRVGQGRRMTNKQILAAHVIYTRRGLSLRQLGELLWQQFGYANAESCAWQIRRGFKNLGLPVRDPIEASRAAHYKHGLATGGKVAPLYKRTLKLQRHGPCCATLANGEPCPRAAQPGSTTCGFHAERELARRKAQVAQINARKQMQAAA